MDEMGAELGDASEEAAIAAAEDKHCTIYMFNECLFSN